MEGGGGRLCQRVLPTISDNFLAKEEGANCCSPVNTNGLQHGGRQRQPGVTTADTAHEVFLEVVDRMESGELTEQDGITHQGTSGPRLHGQRRGECAPVPKV